MPGANSSVNITFNASGGGQVAAEAAAVAAAIASIQGKSVTVRINVEGSKGALGDLAGMAAATKAAQQGAAGMARETDKAGKAASKAGQDAKGARTHFVGLRDDLRATAREAVAFGSGMALGAGGTQNLRKELEGSSRQMRELQAGSGGAMRALESGASRAGGALARMAPSAGGFGRAMRDSVIDMQRLSDGTFGVAEGMRAIESGAGRAARAAREAAGATRAAGAGGGGAAEPLGFRESLRGAAGEAKRIWDSHRQGAAGGAGGAGGDPLGFRDSMKGAWDEAKRIRDSHKQAAAGVGGAGGAVPGATTFVGASGEKYQLKSEQAAAMEKTANAAKNMDKAVGGGRMSMGHLANAAWPVAAGVSMFAGAMESATQQSVGLMKGAAGIGMSFDGMNKMLERTTNQAARGAGGLGLGAMDADLKAHARSMVNDSMPAIRSSIGAVHALENAKMDATGGLSPQIAQFANTLAAHAPEAQRFMQSIGGAALSAGTATVDGLAAATPAVERFGAAVQRAQPGLTRLVTGGTTAMADAGTLTANTLGNVGDISGAGGLFDKTPPGAQPRSLGQRLSDAAPTLLKAAAVATPLGLPMLAGTAPSGPPPGGGAAGLPPGAFMQDPVTTYQHNQALAQSAAAGPAPLPARPAAPPPPASPMAPPPPAAGILGSGGFQPDAGGGAAAMRSHISKIVDQAAPAAAAGGASLGGGLTGGVGAGITSTMTVNDTLIRKHVVTVKDEGAAAAGAHSPATLFIPLGQSMPQGIGLGITTAAQAALAPMQQLTSQLISSTQAQLGGVQGQLGGAGGGGLFGQSGGFGGIPFGGAGTPGGGGAPAAQVRARAAAPPAPQGTGQQPGQGVDASNSARNYSPLAMQRFAAHTERAGGLKAERDARTAAAQGGWQPGWDDVNPFAGTGYAGKPGPATPAAQGWPKGWDDKNPFEDAKKVGEQIPEQIGQGADANKGAALDPLWSLSQAAPKKFKDGIDASSPSMVFAAAGATIPAGVGVGVLANISSATGAVSSMVDAMATTWGGDADKSGREVGRVYATSITDGALAEFQQTGLKKLTSADVSNELAKAMLGQMGSLGKAGGGAQIQSVLKAIHGTLGGGGQPVVVQWSPNLSIDGAPIQAIAQEQAIQVVGQLAGRIDRG